MTPPPSHSSRLSRALLSSPAATAFSLVLSLAFLILGAVDISQSRARRAAAAAVGQAAGAFAPSCVLWRAASKEAPLGGLERVCIHLPLALGTDATSPSSSAAESGGTGQDEGTVRGVVLVAVGVGLAFVALNAAVATWLRIRDASWAVPGVAEEGTTGEEGAVRPAEGEKKEPVSSSSVEAHV